MSSDADGADTGAEQDTEQDAERLHHGKRVEAALTHEHRVIDAGIEAYLASLTAGRPDPSTLLTSLAALRRHIWLEEEFLFPPIQAAGMVMPILVMYKEHGELWRAMDHLAQPIDTDPADRQQAAGRALMDLLEAHNAKEEPIVYPQTGLDLSGAQLAELASYLATGTMPEGWVCREALPGSGGAMPSPFG